MARYPAPMIERDTSIAPCVSVVMAVRNGARHVSEAVESILAQTFEDFEFLIVDDASTDQTQSILENYAQKDRRIRVMRNAQNIGPYPSANRALSEARGDLIARTDADDRSAPERLMRQVAFLAQRPDHLLVGSGYRSIDAAGAVQFLKPNPMDDFAARWTSCFRMPMVHPSFCFRARLPDGAPVRYREDGFAAQDYALVGDLLAAGKVGCIADTLVDYRMHAENITSTRMVEQYEMARTVAMRILAATTDSATAESFAPFFAALYRGQSRKKGAFAASALAFRRLIAEIGTREQRSWLRRRAAGFLAEAFVEPGDRARGALKYLGHAPDFCIPLMLRALEVKGVLKFDPTPGDGTD